MTPKPAATEIGSRALSSTISEIATLEPVAASEPAPFAVPKQHATVIRYLLLLWLCLAAIIVYIQRTAIGIAAPNIQHDLQINDVQMGWVMSGFFWTYAFAQIPTGILGQRLGSRKGLVISVAMASFFCCLIGASWNFISLIMTWMAAGAITAMVFPCCVQSFGNWFPRSGLALPSGLLGSSMSLGAVICASLTGYLLTFGAAPATDVVVATSPFLSWRSIYVIYGGLGIVWAIAFGIWFRNNPADHRQVNQAELDLIRAGVDPTSAAQDTTKVAIPWRRLFLSRSMLMVDAQQLLRNAGYVFFTTWFPTYLKNVHHITIAQAGLLSALPLCGVILGGVIAGSLSDAIYRRTGSRKYSRTYLAAAGQLICAGAIVAAWFSTSLSVSMAFIAVGSMAMAIGACCSYSYVIENCRPHVAPAFGMMNMSGNIGGALSPVLTGMVAYWFGWEAVLLMFACFFFAACFCWLAIDADKQLFEDSVPDSVA